MTDLYEVLGVRRTATDAEIRKAYQKLARLLHPDLNPGDTIAVARFETVQSAFKILSDAARRSDYDHGKKPQREPLADVGFEGFDFSSERVQGAAGFRELFDGVINRPADPAEQGEDLEQTTTISFEESLKGAKRRVQIARLAPCAACGGNGDLAVEPLKCRRCHGTGQLRARRGHMVFTRDCSECAGLGTIRSRVCPRCGGEGRLSHSEWLEVEIPAGVENGSHLRIAGAGNAGRRGSAAGDLVLVIEVLDHFLFRREGSDLVCAVPITMVEAALGGPVEVPTPEGSVTIEIPAGTQAGQRFRLRNRGVPRLGQRGRGDLYVEFRVRIPCVLDETGRAHLRAIAEAYPDDPRSGLLDRAQLASPRPQTGEQGER